MLKVTELIQDLLNYTDRSHAASIIMFRSIILRLDTFQVICGDGVCK